ncbi:DNA-binding protein [Ectopseudomonas guguanensis]|uniref:DNA-binding protein n=1 Tax=Ectopseudomonas guguanensis TaxID=1198456 RepID=UPI0039C2DF56
MSFAIPAATSITSLFVTKTDYYTKKDTGEVVAAVQALSPIPAGAQGNAKGFEVTEYRADASVLDQVDLTQGPVVVKFESQVRPVTDRFGRTTNTQVLTKVIADQPQRQAAQQASKPTAGQPDASKA